MPKIAFYSSGDCYGGIEKNTLRFIGWLSDSRYTISLITSPDSALSKLAEEQNVDIHRLKKPTYFIDLRHARALSVYLKNQNISLLLVIRPRDILMASLVKILLYRSLRLVFFQQSILNLKKHPFLYKMLFRPFDSWISPSEKLAEHALLLTHYKPERMKVIPPCIDAGHFANDTLAKKSARKIFRLPEDRIILGAIGKYNNTYALDFSIRAIQFLERNHHDVDLLIYGRSGSEQEEEYRNFLTILARECKVEDRVHFRIAQDKLITFFRSIDIFVTHRQHQPYDMIVHKAMASGLSVIAPYSEINSELLNNGNLGMLYHQKDLADFSNKIIHLITQPKIRNHLETEGQKAIFSRFDRSSGCKKIQLLFQKLLDLQNG
ncbi:MAG: glycosyltransferase family 4 protein [Bacteroidales bacterium]|nr:glycosyltransferase family 4 protein [Bacteroidales bacterium]